MEQEVLMTEVTVFGEDPDEGDKRTPDSPTAPDIFHSAEVERDQYSAEIAASKEGKPPTRALANVEMRVLGFSFQQIADKLLYASPGAAYNAFMAAVAAVHNPEDTTSMRQKQSARLELLFKSVIGKAIDQKSPDQLAYNKRATEIIAEISKLHGVNAPQVVAVVNPDARKFDEVVQRLKEIEAGEVEPEGDIFGMIEGEDGVFRDPEEGDSDAA